MMKRKQIGIVLAVLILILLLPMQVFATDESGKCGENANWTLAADGTLTISGTGDMEDYNFDAPAPWSDMYISAVVVADGITGVGAYAFYQQKSIVSVQLADTVTRLGVSAFAECEGLGRANIPTGVTVLETNVFNRCFLLESVEIPDGVISIGDGAFQYCEKLMSLHIPDSVENVGMSAFTGTGYTYNERNWTDGSLYCDGVLLYVRGMPATSDGTPFARSYTVKDGTRVIAANAFSGCADFKTVHFPVSLISIGKNAFMDCSDLTEISLPDSVRLLDNFAFFECGKLERVTLSRSLKKLGASLFDQCFALESVNIPAGVTEIGDYAFRHCRALTAITIPDSVERIGVEAFEDTGLTKLIVPETVKEIGAYAVGMRQVDYREEPDEYGLWFEYVPIDGFTLACVKNSAAYEYAEKNGITVELIEGAKTGGFILGTAYALGDLNGDGRVNSVDARLALRAAARLDTLSDFQKTVGDVNGDGTVNSKDARLLLRAAAHLEALPEKFFTA